MKMLISDYDYTIKPFENNPSIYERIVFKKNIDSIKRFIDRDNIFVIATGRTTSSIMDELKKYKINYSYLIAYNGRVIIDRNNKVIYANYLNQDIIKELVNREYVNNYCFFDEYKENDSTTKPIYLKMKLSTYKDIKQIIINIKEQYPCLKISLNKSSGTLLIRNEFDKSKGINELIKKEKLDVNNEDIYTIGDEINDFEMISNYNGYIVPFSNPNLSYATHKVIPSVNKLIKIIKKNV